MKKYALLCALYGHLSIGSQDKVSFGSFYLRAQSHRTSKTYLIINQSNFHSSNYQPTSEEGQKAKDSLEFHTLSQMQSWRNRILKKEEIDLLHTRLTHHYLSEPLTAAIAGIIAQDRAEQHENSQTYYCSIHDNNECSCVYTTQTLVGILLQSIENRQRRIFPRTREKNLMNENQIWATNVCSIDYALRALGKSETAS